MDNSKISNVHSTFPLSRKAADALGDQAGYDYSFLHTARRLTNWLREHYPRKSSPVSPGELTAAGLMGKIIYSVIDYYLVEQNPQLFRKYSSYLSEKLDPPLPYAALVDFVKLFPPAALLTSRQSPEEYLSSLQKTPSRFRLETFGLLLYILADKNPALNLIPCCFLIRHLARQLPTTKPHKPHFLSLINNLVFTGTRAFWLSLKNLFWKTRIQFPGSSRTC